MSSDPPASSSDFLRTGRKLGSVEIAVLTLLRVGIGWHFLYEGLVKILDPGWSSAGYLASSRWILSDVFHWIASRPAAVALVDLLNAWGLASIGAALMLGLFTRLAGVAGMLLLALYYAAHPPFLASGQAEGNYLIIDKNIVELLALLAIVILPAGRFTGLDRLLATRYRRKRAGGVGVSRDPSAGHSDAASSPQPLGSAVSGRREILKALAS
ncbi:MAG: DoxX family protein, partial [Planctomycetes bacterium]|nr:DoxX family protein [Planctomycetota bacterium]